MTNRNKATIFGDDRRRLYSVWKQMVKRCTDPEDPSFDNYGARGIRVCLEWLGGFDSFAAWARVSGYARGLSIDRINNDGGYEPQNCRWADRRTQNLNKRKLRHRAIGRYGSSRFRGVVRATRGTPWQVSIKGVGYVGRFATELEAALAFDDAVYAARGDLACLNFPERKSPRNTKEACTF